MSLHFGMALDKNYGMALESWGNLVLITVWQPTEQCKVMLAKQYTLRESLSRAGGFVAVQEVSISCVLMKSQHSG